MQVKDAESLRNRSYRDPFINLNRFHIIFLCVLGAPFGGKIGSREIIAAETRDPWNYVYVPLKRVTKDYRLKYFGPLKGFGLVANRRT